MDQATRISSYALEVERRCMYITSRFRDLNKDAGLTPEDKKRLKEYYLKTCVTPRIQKTIRKHFPEDFTDR